jgi:hypothetical protein
MSGSFFDLRCPEHPTPNNQKASNPTPNNPTPNNPTPNNQQPNGKQLGVQEVEEGFLEFVRNQRNEMLDEALRDEPLDPAVAARAAEFFKLDRTADEQFRRFAELLAGRNTWAEELRLAASNRNYERQLQDVAEVRQELEEIQQRLAAKKAVSIPLEDRIAISRLSVMLRTAISESLLYANEAYVTDGAVNHAVVGLQLGNPIRQTKAESMHAFFENVGDVLKELDRHDNFGEAILKSSKYVWRVGDSAYNAGIDGISDSRDILAMREMGQHIAQVIRKNTELTEANRQRVAITHLKKYVPKVDNVQQFRETVIRTAINVAQEWSNVPPATRSQYGREVSIAPAKHARNKAG